MGAGPAAPRGCAPPPSITAPVPGSASAEERRRGAPQRGHGRAPRLRPEDQQVARSGEQRRGAAGAPRPGPRCRAAGRGGDGTGGAGRAAGPGRRRRGGGVAAAAPGAKGLGATRRPPGLRAADRAARAEPSLTGAGPWRGAGPAVSSPRPGRAGPGRRAGSAQAGAAMLRFPASATKGWEMRPCVCAVPLPRGRG